MNHPISNSNLTISNPTENNVTRGSGHNQSASSEQPQPATLAPALTSKEQVQAFLSRVSKPYTDHSETPQADENTRDGLNNLPNELLDNILTRVPEGSLDQQLGVFTTLSRVNRRFRELVLPKPLQVSGPQQLSGPQQPSGPLQRKRQELLGLKTLREENRQKPEEADANYAFRLKKACPNLTPKQAALIVSDPEYLHFERFLSTDLRWQPVHVQQTIERLLTQCPKGDLDIFDHPLRLKEVCPDVTAEDAALAATGGTGSYVEEWLSRRLEFQSSEVKGRVAAIRANNHRDPAETDDFLYALRVKQAHPELKAKDAVFAAFDQAEPYIVKKLLRRAQKLRGEGHLMTDSEESD